MRRLCFFLSLLLVSVLLLQCQQEIESTGAPGTTGQVATPDPVTATLQGNVFDETGAPAAGITVQAGTKTAVTNAAGYFRINAAPLDKKSAVVTAVKPGYFKAYRTFGATTGANYVSIKLIKKILAGTVNAAAGGEVTLINGSKVSLPANGIVTASTGAAYGGTVSVFAAYIDPTATDIEQTVPGSFMANDKDGHRVVLTSYGMMAVDLEAVSGEKLQVKSGAKATLTMPIPASLQASAPAGIALWSVDETTGIWKEEGTAVKTGSAYVGQVSHFSFWNCDVSANAVVLSLTLQTNNGSPLANVKVRLKRATSGWAAYGWTDSLGQVSGYVPNNEALVMDLLNDCYTPSYTQNIGPFTQNTSLGIVSVANPGNSLVTVKGKVVTCAGTAVTAGYAMVSYGYLTRYAAADANGDFQTTFTRCPAGTDTMKIIGVDATGQQQSPAPVWVTVTTPVTNAGSVSACGTVATLQFINFTVDTATYNLVSPADSLMGATSGQVSPFSTSIRGKQRNTVSIDFDFRSAAQVPGSYPISYLRLNTPADSVWVATPFNVTVTAFPASAGGYYEGNFSGQIPGSGGSTHTITATFRIRRQW